MPRPDVAERSSLSGSWGAIEPAGGGAVVSGADLDARQALGLCR